MCLNLCIVILFRKSTFQKTYSHIIYTKNGPQPWPIGDELRVNPPLLRMTVGCPKKMRKKTHDEPKNPHVLPRNLTTVTCHKCGSMGHNMRTFKGNRETNWDMPKGDNNTKKSKNTKRKKKGERKSTNVTQPT